MSWLASIAIAVLAGVLGLFAGGFVMNACVRWYRISGFEGAAGYAVVFVALLSGVAGLILGLVTARLLPGEGAAGFFRALGGSLGVVAGVAGLAALVAWTFADLPPKIGGRELVLEIEYRLPVGAKDPTAAPLETSTLELHSLSGNTSRRRVRGGLRPADARLEDGRWIVPGAVHLFTTRGKLTFSAELDGEQMLGFLLPFSGSPGREHLEWSDWGPRPPKPLPPWPDSKPSFRFRVRPVEPHQ